MIIFFVLNNPTRLRINTAADGGVAYDFVEEGRPNYFAYGGYLGSIVTARTLGAGWAMNPPLALAP
jgi:hypothetical protein